jgi:hypothetical protein
MPVSGQEREFHLLLDLCREGEESGAQAVYDCHLLRERKQQRSHARVVVIAIAKPRLRVLLTKSDAKLVKIKLVFSTKILKSNASTLDLVPPLLLEKSLAWWRTENQRNPPACVTINHRLPLKEFRLARLR